ncbi:MAG: hypothetical protein ACF8Q5_04220 [Phycisphaerales bacterium JB040]
MRTNATTMSLVAGMAVGGAVLAGPPRAGEISEHARVLMHVDLDTMRSTHVGEWLLGRMEDESNDFAELREVLPGFTLRAEGGLTGLTAYAGNLNDDGPENLVVVLKGDEHLRTWFDAIADKLEQEAGQEPVKVGGHSALLVPMDDETGYLTLVREGGSYTAVLGQSEESFTEGVGVLTGDRSSLGAEGRAELSDAWRDGTIMLFGASKLELFGQMDEASAVMESVKSVWGRFGEDDGTLFAQAKFTSDADEKVQQLVTAYHGLMAFGMLMQNDHEELREVMKMAQSLTMQASGGSLIVSFERDAEEMIRWIEEQEARKDGWDDGHDDHHHDDDGWGHEDDDDDGWDD